MKTAIYDLNGAKSSDVELPEVFSSTVREDIAVKMLEAMKWEEKQPYTHDPKAGRKHSASGTISHRRHEWKGHYGKGIARVPRKAMWRRGTQFYWVATEVNSTRGGRRVHGPSLNLRSRKINIKEMIIAMNSAIAATANEKFVSSRYATLSDVKFKLPVVVEAIPSKTKDAISMLKTIYGDASSLVLKVRSVRAGKGKNRARPYKSTAGLLVVKSDKENVKFSGLDVKSVSELTIADLYPLGRLTVYTKQALEELKNVA
jgi:ribosomal protein L4